MKIKKDIDSVDTIAVWLTAHKYDSSHYFHLLSDIW